MKKLYVGNLPFTATEDEIKELGGRALRLNEAQDKPRGGGGGRW